MGGLPHRPGEGNGADVHRVRDLVAQRHVERRHGAIRLDHGGGGGRRHVGEPRRRGELTQECGVRLDVHRDPREPDAHRGRAARVRRTRHRGVARALRRRRPGLARAYALRRDARQPRVRRQRLRDLIQDVGPDVAVGVDAADDVDLRGERVADPLRLALLRDHRVEPPLLHPHCVEPRLGHAQPRRLRKEQQHRPDDHHGRRRARRDQPRVPDRGDEAAEIRERELESGARSRPLLLAGEEVDFDHAARLNASPTDSISSGATSSTSTASNTESRTFSRCTGLATSTGTLSRLPSASFNPGMRAPPPIVYTRPRPPAEREAVARNAAARSTPTAISSPRASTYGARSALWVCPCIARSASSAESPFSRCRSSRKRRVPTERLRVSTGTPSSSTFTFVTSWPMFTRPTTPCIASGWFSSKALWIAKASTSMIHGSSPASFRSPTRPSTSSRLAATSSTFICSPSASGSRIWKSSSTLAMSNGTCCSASQRITSRASASFIRSIWIFLTITSRPPTAVTTDFCLTPAVENSPRIASATIPGSMTSPSTMASAATSVVATFASSGSLPEWSMTTSLMMPEPISRPTEVFLPPRNPNRAIEPRG